MPKDLVIVRAGDQSVHGSWLVPTGDYDLVVSYYGADRERYRTEALLRHDAPGGKLEAIHALLTAHPSLLDDRRFVWLPDDDIRMEPRSLARLFALMAEHRLALAQPALLPTSHVNLRITAQHQGFILRRTTYVEVMAPCLAVPFLQEVLPRFMGQRFGWGLDAYWSMPAGRHGGAAIIDAITMAHTRPTRTGPLYATGDPEREKEAFRQSVGLVDFPRHKVTGAIGLDGRVLTERDAMLARLLRAASAKLPWTVPR